MSADVLQLRLSPHHSIDLVRLPKSRRFRIVFAERQGVQRRAFVEISFDDAMRIAKFLAAGSAVPETIDGDLTMPATSIIKDDE